MKPDLCAAPGDLATARRMTVVDVLSEKSDEDESC